ncbi:MAG: division/cell wall cluster transcriptional repressor MraZ [Chloroflexota bacterium]|nr:division/cell wall cluster transcriptional repressor MraZ [Chloroflexota bacterium]
MLIGQFEHSLDTKGRLTLPSGLAGQLAAGVVLTSGLEGCIYLFPAAEFEKLSGRIRELPFTDTRARKLRRRLFPQAHAVDPDKQRRILIPQWLRDHAGITDRVLIAGMDIYAELWAPDAWREQSEYLSDELTDEEYFAGLDV